MYAIFADGSRQFKAVEGQVVKIDFRRDTSAPEGELVGAKKGTTVELTQVLFYTNGDDTRVGRPLIEGAKIVAEVVEHPTVKTYIGKYRRRKNYRRLRGHRQHFTAVKVTQIVLA